MDRQARPIGLFVYGEPPDAFMPPRRTRALLAEAALQGADLHLFSAADCDPVAGLVTARRWRNGRLEAARVPLPPLVVILSNPIRAAHHRASEWIRANAEVVDDRGPDKLAQVRLLEASPLARHAIPAEAVNADDLAAQVAASVGRHGAVVVKPVDGMRGGNIHFLVPDGRGAFLLRTGRRSLSGTLAELIAVLERKVAGRLRYRDFMIQRYVPSRFNEMAVTLRIDVVRTPDDGWSVTRRAARLGVTGSLATNTAGGSAQMFLERFLSFAGRDPGIAGAAERLAVATAGLIGAQPDASVIELGIDLALGADDTLYVIEANAHPEANWAEHDRAVAVVAWLIARFDRIARSG